MPAAHSGGPGLGLLGNGLVFGLIATLWLIEGADGEAYYGLVQEDGPLEWATVLFMVPAAWLCAIGFRRVRAAGRIPWFFAGLLAFCVFFAGEEISWGQRLMSYQPPEYFLEHNSQLELNVHNLFKKHLRTKYLLMGILGLYGVLLPLLHMGVPPARTLLRRVGVVVPPVVLVPAFAATGLLLWDYPWKYTGEVAECLFAFGLFLAVASRVAAMRDDEPGRLSPPLRMLVTTGGVALLAAATPPVLGVLLHGSDEQRAEVTEQEVRALVEDWHTHTETTGRAPSKCGTHIRLYTWVRKHDYETFRRGAFAGMELDSVRQRYFLDPWNNPYWVRHVCRRDRTRGIFIYSFGPDSRRDSTKSGLAGDDIGVEFRPR